MPAGHPHRAAPPAELRPARTAGQLASARELFLEYAAEIGQSLDFQGFLAEVAGLPGPYRPPRGRLLLAYVRGELAGCGAWRRFSAGTAELKRVYLRPRFRRHGDGRRLVCRLVDDARAAGYRRIVLDTLDRMHAAQALYRKLGFLPIPPYRPNPLPGARFYALEFGPGRPTRHGTARRPMRRAQRFWPS